MSSNNRDIPINPGPGFYTEVYDTKVMNAKVRPKSAFVMCDECKHWQGHSVNCTKVDVPSLASLLQTSQRNEEIARERGARWLEKLQAATGKIAILKHENNQLRRQNKKVRKENERLQKSSDFVCFVDTKLFPYRYVKTESGNYDKYTWNYKWIWTDTVSAEVVEAILSDPMAVTATFNGDSED